MKRFTLVTTLLMFSPITFAEEVVKNTLSTTLNLPGNSVLLTQTEIDATRGMARQLYDERRKLLLACRERGGNGNCPSSTNKYYEAQDNYRDIRDNPQDSPAYGKELAFSY